MKRFLSEEEMKDFYYLEKKEQEIVWENRG